MLLKAIKIAWYWHKNRQEDEWNRRKYPDRNSGNYSHLTFEKRSPKDTMLERHLLQQMLLRKLDIYLWKILVFHPVQTSIQSGSNILI
jgi:hypothetical protein